ncbi:unnamed protein product [Pseudo-nitzschia multistriata]|uniref:Fe2OG dioxygenase domain-containing protein n=1 Tax=Pseudo-nitzschia multistriata TaxID=183589 RepID=A0A448ZEZ0_9STRA|nr:unnamed protein product [Pseudo-nitzschia multistriata]
MLANADAGTHQAGGTGAGADATPSGLEPTPAPWRTNSTLKRPNNASPVDRYAPRRQIHKTDTRVPLTTNEPPPLPPATLPRPTGTMDPDGGRINDPPGAVPDGFSVSENAVPEESWERIRSYLGLRIDQSGRGLRIEGPGASGIPWESTPFPQNRPVAQFGFRYDYEKSAVAAGIGAGEAPIPGVPELFRELLLQPYYDETDAAGKGGEDGADENGFSQCIVNVYLPAAPEHAAGNPPPVVPPSINGSGGSSIPWHVDDPAFGPVILVFSFGDARPLCMRLNHGENGGDRGKGRSHSCSDGAGSRSYSYFTAHPPHRSRYVLSEAARDRWEHSVPPGPGWRVSITFRTLARGSVAQTQP